ncbi:MAG: two-component sensor histidine kinase [Ilumatobacteraceae bacterium]|nr:two-component sensor histidine kinase [Ilumatobacteraceae bacterium]
MLGMRRPGKWLVARYVGQFAFAGVVAVVIVGLATAIASRRVGEREAISEARTTTLIKAEGLVEPALTDGLVTGDDPAAQLRVTSIIGEDVLDATLIRVKLWTADGRILVSDEPRLVGTQFALDAAELAALSTGRIEAEVSDLAAPENRYERELGTKLLEVYLPVHTPTGIPLLFEAYYRYNVVQANGSRLWRSFAPIALGALIMLEVVQIPLAWSLARRLRQRLREREALLQRALESSEVERRQIASDLHDGVVQDLAGVAYALSARARRTDADEQSAELAATVRETIRSLRSLVIDLYPPNLREEGLESALRDLVDRAADGEARVELDAAGLRDPVPDRVAALIYRAAQEALRNALQHAGAGLIRVRAAAEGTYAVLEVSDDGRGFDAATLAAREAEGHVGLKALRGVVADGGGRVRIDSVPGAGTTLVVEVLLP